MANPNAKLIPVNLAGTINLNKYKADVDTTYSVFNKKNAPIFGGVLSPTYKKEKKEIKNYVSSSEHEAWETYQGSIFVDGKEYKDVFSSLSFVKEEDFVKPVSGELFEVYDEKFYVVKNNNNYTVHLDFNEQPYEVIIQVDGPVRFRLFHREFTGDDGQTHVEAVAVESDESSSTIWYFDRNGWLSEHVSSLDINDSSCVIAEAKSHQILINIYKNEKKYVEETKPSEGNLPTSVFYDYQAGGFGATNGRIGRLDIQYSAPDYSPVPTLAGFSFLSPNGVVSSIAFDTKSGTRFYVTNKVSTIDGLNYTMKISSWDDTGVAQLPVTHCAYRLEGSGLCKKASIFCRQDDGRMVGYYSLGNGYWVKPNTIIDFYKDRDRWITFTKDDIKGDVSSTSHNFFSKPGGFFLPNGSFRTLFGSDGIIRGISYAEDKHKRGVLLTPWGSVSQEHGVYFNGFLDVVYYNEIEQKWTRVKVSSLSGKDSSRLKIVGDYLIINTISPGNCLNMNTFQIYNYADDWNNRIYDLSDKPMKYTQGTSAKHKKFISSAANIAYPITGVPVCSAAFASEECFHSDDSNKDNDIESDLQAYRGNTEIDIFMDNVYYYSPNGYNPKFAGVSYPVGFVYYNPDIISKYIKTPTNQDIIKSGSFGYSLLYFNSMPIFLYLSTSQISKMDNMFVVQGRGFATIENKIVEYSIANGSISGTSAIADISGLRFISSTPYRALFWSETNKSMYSFTGDNILQIAFQANSIGDIYGAEYNPSTGTVIVTTDIGAIFLNETLGTFIEKDLAKTIPSVSVNNSVSFFDYINDRVVSLKYHNDNKEPGFITDDIVVETELFGAGNNIVSETDCWYIRLEDVERERRRVTVSCKTLTDIGVKTEEKAIFINPNDWDKETDTYYLKYQPKYQAGIGCSLFIKTNAKIANITVGTKPTTVQLTKNNI